MADLFSDYNIVEKIGTGARSTIYQVVDPKTNQVFALKKVVREAHEDTRYLEQAIQEYEISHIVDHPYLRKSYEIKKVRRLPLRLYAVEVVMEFVRGISLEQHRPTDILEIVNLFTHVAEGLNALHEKGFLHTDIKPNNIMILNGGAVKIIDFGQGCKIGTTKPRIQGTPDYIAPEQVMRRPLTCQTDVFNFGATLYWALTGKNVPTTIPKGAPRGTVNVAASPRPIPQPHELNGAVPTALSRLVMECCNERPQDRPKRMSLIINRLEIMHHMLTKRNGQAPSDMGRSGGDSSTGGDSEAESSGNDAAGSSKESS